jgi:hypothetical protein
MKNMLVEDFVRQILVELHVTRQNLQATQARCTALVEENRSLRLACRLTEEGQHAPNQ